MAEKFTDKTEYMASLRDKNRIESIKARVDISDPTVAGELYNRLKDKPAYFETEVGKKFMQSLFVTYKGAKRLSMPAPKLDEEENIKASGRAANSGRTAGNAKTARPGRTADPEKAARAARSRRTSDSERVAKPSKIEGFDRSVKSDKSTGSGKSAKSEKFTWPWEKAKSEKSASAERTTRSEKSARSERPANSERSSRRENTGKSDTSLAKASKITIVDGSDNLKVKYNRSIFLDDERLDALDVLTGTKQEYNDFWDGENDMAEDYEPVPDPAKRKKRLKALLIGVAGVAAIFLAIFLGKEISYRIENYNSKQKLTELQNIVSRNADGRRSSQDVTHAHAAEPTKTETSDEEGQGNGSGSGEETSSEQAEPGPTEPAEPMILPEYAELYERNPDLVGWMNIPGTVINYPVMQTKDDMEYYLYRDFDRGNDKNGLPFVDARSDVFEPTTNVLIYGHCMSSGAMFASLLNYKDKAYYDAHPVIYFDTIYEHAEYEIIACFQSRVAYVGENVFRYYSFIDTDSKEEFEDFITNIKAMSYYETGETAEFGDSLITLSTCDKEITNGRMVIVARKAK